jgi:hypothetical protein
MGSEAATVLVYTASTDVLPQSIIDLGPKPKIRTTGDPSSVNMSNLAIPTPEGFVLTHVPSNESRGTDSG